MEKHGLSPAGIDNALKQIQEERDRRAYQIIQDFLSGMQIHDIATRNGFPVERFLDVLRAAVSLQPRRPSHLKVASEQTGFQDPNRDRRRYPRIRCPVLKDRVWDASFPGREGTILDISEKGVAVRGIFAQKDAEKTLLISESDYDTPDPLVLTCICRWADGGQHPHIGQSAGFEIVAISETDDKHLRSWIDAEQG